MLIAALAAAIPASSAGAQGQERRAGLECQRLLGVVFRVTHEQGRITSLEVEHVIDGAAWPTPEEAARHPIQVDLPPAYLAAARAFLDRRRYDGARNPFWTFTLYDPAQPDRVGIQSNCRR